MISNIVHFFIEQKFCKHHFYGAENNKLKSQDNSKSIEMKFSVVYTFIMVMTG